VNKVKPLDFNDASKSTELILIGRDVFYLRLGRYLYYVKKNIYDNIYRYTYQILKTNNVMVFIPPPVYMFSVLSLAILRNGYSKCDFKRCAGYFFVSFTYIIYVCFVFTTSLFFFLTWLCPIVNGNE